MDQLLGVGIKMFTISRDRGRLCVAVQRRGFENDRRPWCYPSACCSAYSIRVGEPDQ